MASPTPRGVLSPSPTPSSSPPPGGPAARTSPRLDAPAAFFGGVPAHAVAAMASWSSGGVAKPAAAAAAGEPSEPARRYLLTAGAQGELVHWVSLRGPSERGHMR